MDLALALHWPSLALMERSMSEREFRRWIRRCARKPLPSVRAELYLAQIASVIAKTTGNKVSIQDFILDFSGKAAEELPAENVGALAAALPARGVRKLGQGRKKKVA